MIDFEGSQFEREIILWGVRLLLPLAKYVWDKNLGGSSSST